MNTDALSQNCWTFMIKMFSNIALNIPFISAIIKCWAFLISLSFMSMHKIIYLNLIIFSRLLPLLYTSSKMIKYLYVCLFCISVTHTLQCSQKINSTLGKKLSIISSMCYNHKEKFDSASDSVDGISKSHKASSADY